MEDKDNLALEANRILNDLGVSKALNEATLHEVIFGTSCILITKDGTRAIEPYSEEWFKIIKE